MLTTPNNTQVAVSMKEQILRMPQGTNKSGGGAMGGSKGIKTRNGSFSGPGTRTKTVSDCATQAAHGIENFWGGGSKPIGAEAQNLSGIAA